MRYLGLDLGTRSLGLSISDETKTIASALKTIRYNENDYEYLLDELSKISNHIAIYTNHNGIQTIIAQMIKNLNNNTNSTIINLKERTILLAATLVLFLIASNT